MCQKGEATMIYFLVGFAGLAAVVVTLTATVLYETYRSLTRWE